MIETLAWIVLGAALVPAHRRASRDGALVPLVAVELIAFVLVMIASASEATWVALAQEDAAVEWATVVAFVLAGGWFAFGVRRRLTAWPAKLACVLLAAVCVVIAGEEISWGQRLFAFQPPDVFLERNFQQELNLHNVVMHSKYLVMVLALLYGIAGPLLVRLHPLARFESLVPPLALAPIFLGVVAIQLAYPVDLTGEGAELLLGLGFLATALVRSQEQRRLAVGVIVGSLAAGAVIAAVLARLVFAGDDEGRRIAEAELAQLRAEVTAHATPKLATKHVHKRVYTAIRDGYLDLARAGDARSRYFLDPWNNPYWISSDKRTKAVVLYSFGPNRRRDLDLDDASEDPGDDVVVRFAR